jgi:hypothetical protein
MRGHIHTFLSTRGQPCYKWQLILTFLQFFKNATNLLSLTLSHIIQESSSTNLFVIFADYALKIKQFMHKPFITQSDTNWIRAAKGIGGSRIACWWPLNILQLLYTETAWMKSTLCVCKDQWHHSPGRRSPRIWQYSAARNSTCLMSLVSLRRIVGLEHNLLELIR